MGIPESGIQMLSSFFGNKRETTPTAPSSGNPLFDMILQMRSGEKAPLAQEIKEISLHEREKLFGNVWVSVLNRYFPNVSKLMDISSIKRIANKDPESFQWQNEFENITALSIFIPDSFLHHITDWFASSKIFLSILEHWPVKGKELADKIRTDKNPDDVINTLRMMHQDMITGKVSFNKIAATI